MPKIVAFGSQLQVEAREWYLAEVIRIALADSPLTPAERAATGHLANALGMTQAQAIGVVALTEQNAGLLSPGATPVPRMSGRRGPMAKTATISARVGRTRAASDSGTE